MHRITQMNVVPDLVGNVVPSMDLAVIFSKESGRVIPGSYLSPSQVSSSFIRVNKD